METPIVETMRHAHATLQNDLRILREAVQSRSGASVIDLCDRLGAIRDHVANHFRLEEQGGYMDVVKRRQPLLERTIQHLAAEHPQLLQSLDAIVRDASRATAIDDRLRREITDWMEGIHQHEDRENRLIEEAFDLDIGPSD